MLHTASPLTDKGSFHPCLEQTCCAAAELLVAVPRRQASRHRRWPRAVPAVVAAVCVARPARSFLRRHPRHTAIPVPQDGLAVSVIILAIGFLARGAAGRTAWVRNRKGSFRPPFLFVVVEMVTHQVRAIRVPGKRLGQLCGLCRLQRRCLCRLLFICRGWQRRG